MIDFSIGMKTPGVFIEAEDLLPTRAQQKAVEEALGRVAREIIVERAKSGLHIQGGTGGSLIPMQPYSRNRLSVPINRRGKDSGRFSGDRISKYRTIMVRASASKPRFSAGGVRHGAPRQWVSFDGGYAELKALAGISQRLMFTGKMLQDFRVRARMQGNEPGRAVFELNQLFNRIVSDAFTMRIIGAEGLRRVSTESFGGRRDPNAGKFVTSPTYSDLPREVEEIPLYAAVFDFGFSTVGSHTVARHLAHGWGRRQPINWVGMARSEGIEVAKEGSLLLQKALSDTPTGNAGRGTILSPRDNQGHFIPFQT